MDEKEISVRLALVEQSVASIKEDVTEMKRTMNEFLKKLEEGYVRRTEYDEVKKRLDTMETRMWGLLVGILMLLAKEAFAWFAG